MVIQTSVRNFKVDGSSMNPTLEGGQYLMVNKLVYFLAAMLIAGTAGYMLYTMGIL